MELEAEGALSGGERRGRALRLAVVATVSCLLLAAAALVARNANKGSDGKQVLFWGGPLSFDMVHTHILNMKMRRSRLKERLKEAALKRKDRELAKEHGFNRQGSLQSSAPPQQQLQQQPPMQPQYQPQQYQQAPQYAQAPQQYPQPQFQQMPQGPPQYGQPQYQQPPQGYMQPPQYAQQPPMQQYPAYEQPPQEAPQLAQQPLYPPPQQAANPWGGQTYSAGRFSQVQPTGPTESSSDDKDQQRAQAAASIQAYEAFMHGQAPAKAAK